jgi:hypothetical protein
LWGFCDFRNAFDTTRAIIVDDGGKKPKVEKIKEATYWLQNDKLIEQYHEVCMDPTPGAWGSYAPYARFNLFQGWPSIPGANPKKAKLDRIIYHLKHVWCKDDETMFNNVILWFAHMMQIPWRKPTWAIVLVSSPGMGKSQPLEKLMKPIIGPGLWGKTSADQLSSQFTKPIAFKLFITVEEAVFSGDKKVMEILKDRITSDTIKLESKGVDAIHIPHFGRFILTSNHDHVAHIVHDDRRFLILDLLEDHKEDWDYFKALDEAVNDPSTQLAFRNYLLNWKPEEHGLSWDVLYRPPPVTEKKREQVDFSLSPAQEFFRDVLVNGRIVETDLKVLNSGLLSWGLDERVDIGMNELKSLFASYLRAVVPGNSFQYEMKKYSSEFKRFFGKTPSDMSGVMRVEGRVCRLIKLPPRRELVEAAFKKGLLTEEGYKYATTNPMSHLLDNTVDGTD